MTDTDSTLIFYKDRYPSSQIYSQVTSLKGFLVGHLTYLLITIYISLLM